MTEENDMDKLNQLYDELKISTRRRTIIIAVFGIISVAAIGMCDASAPKSSTFIMILYLMHCAVFLPVFIRTSRTEQTIMSDICTIQRRLLKKE